MSVGIKTPFLFVIFLILLNIKKVGAENLTSAFDYDPRSFRRYKLADLFLAQSSNITSDGFEEFEANKMHQKTLRLDCPEAVEDPLGHCPTHCRKDAECLDNLRCCPTKCGGHMCRRPYWELEAINHNVNETAAHDLHEMLN